MTNNKVKTELLNALVQIEWEKESGFHPQTLNTVQRLAAESFDITDEGEVSHFEMFGAYTLNDWFGHDIRKEPYLYTPEFREERRRAAIIAGEPTQNELDAMNADELWSKANG